MRAKSLGIETIAYLCFETSHQGLKVFHQKWQKNWYDRFVFVNYKFISWFCMIWRLTLCRFRSQTFFFPFQPHNDRAILFIIVHAFIKRRRFSMHRTRCSFAIAAKCTTFIVVRTARIYNIYINERHRCHRALHPLWYLSETQGRELCVGIKNWVSMLATREWVANRS